jgi:hypothetical protein
VRPCAAGWRAFPGNEQTRPSVEPDVPPFLRGTLVHSHHNGLRTAVLLGGMSSLLLLAGGALGGRGGLMWIVGIGSFMAAASSVTIA